MSELGTISLTRMWDRSVGTAMVAWWQISTAGRTRQLGTCRSKGQRSRKLLGNTTGEEPAIEISSASCTQLAAHNSQHIQRNTQDLVQRHSCDCGSVATVAVGSPGGFDGRAGQNSTRGRKSCFVKMVHEKTVDGSTTVLPGLCLLFLILYLRPLPLTFSPAGCFSLREIFFFPGRC